MKFLLLVSLIWAFSFGLIGNKLSGLDSSFVAAIRLGLALIVFLPFLRITKIAGKHCLWLLLIGAVQFGLMYVTYIQAFKFLPSHLVALFSIMTPIYVVLIHDLRTAKMRKNHLIAACLSVMGAAIIKAKGGTEGSIWIGFCLMQIAGFAFAFGQVSYREWKRKHPEFKDSEVFAIPYLGGFLLAGGVSLLTTDFSGLNIRMEQWQVLAYLGIVASGLGFFLWNKGAALSRPGTLAAFNNAVVPLAMTCSLFVFGEISDIQTDSLLRLLLGSICIVGAVVIAEKSQRER